MLREINSHSLWMNSAALAAAGITAATPDPEPGFSIVVRDAAGHPTGWLLEDSAMRLVREVLAPPSPERLRETLLGMQDGYAAAGLTAAFDAGIFMVAERDGWEVLADLDRRGSLGQIVIGSKVAAFDPEDAIPILAAARDRYDLPNVRIDTLKVFVDGVPEAHTSAYLEPYDDLPGSSGPLAATEDQIRRWVVDADAAGLSAHLHAIGDRAVRTALDAVEAARSRKDSGVIHTICHGDLIDPTDLPRFAELGVVWNTSGQWIASSPVDEVMRRRLGSRADRHYTVRSALEAGVVVTLGADFPASAYVSTYRPLVLIESAVTRRLAGVTEGDPLPPASEAIGVGEALRAMTASAAAQLGISGRTGSLTPGKDADFVVLGADLFRIPAHQIAATPVLVTARAGRITHEAL
jgi:predicted amidohydrolase YtcJ